MAGRPSIDLGFEVQLQRLVRETIAAGQLRSAHDLSEGGLAVAVAESAFRGGIGATVQGGWLAAALRADVALFGEAQSRIIVSVAAEDAAAFEKRAHGSDVPCVRLGTVGGDRLVIGHIDVRLEEARARWSAGLADALAGWRPGAAATPTPSWAPSRTAASMRSLCCSSATDRPVPSRWPSAAAYRPGSCPELTMPTGLPSRRPCAMCCSRRGPTSWLWPGSPPSSSRSWSTPSRTASSTSTVHVVTDQVDAGPIVGQAAIPVLPAWPSATASRELRRIARPIRRRRRHERLRQLERVCRCRRSSDGQSTRYS